MEIPRVYGVGETVYDIIFRNYEPVAGAPGGSAFNAMITLGRLSVPTAFISEVGNDTIGNRILLFLEENGVDNELVIRFEDGKSALSLAFLDENSDAQYEFYKDYPNQRLNKELPLFSSRDYLLFGSFYGLNPVLRPQIKALLHAANQAGTLVYYDPNFRAGHVEDLEILLPIIEENFQASTIVRASNEDIENIYGVKTAADAYERVKPYCSIFIYTEGADGVTLFTPDFHNKLEIEAIEPLSTIGAGDTFNAGIAYGLYSRGTTVRSIEDLRSEDWMRILNQAALFSKEVCMSFENYIPLEFAQKYSGTN